MLARINKEVHGIRRNLASGLRLLAFRRVNLRDFYISQDQILVLSFIYSVVVFFGGYMLALPKPVFSFYGIATITTQFAFITLCGYGYSKLIGKKYLVHTLYVILLSMWPFFYLGWLAIGKSNFFNYLHFFGDTGFEYLLFNMWIAAVVVSAVSGIFSTHKKSVFKTLIIYLVALGIPLNYFTFGNFWHQTYAPGAEYEKYKSIDQEATYYRQFKLLENVRSNILPQRTGISDIYFVGFGSYAMQDVFMKEVKYAKNMLDEKFDTKGRSVELINNINTLDTTLLASMSNLGLVLEHIGKLIDPDEDVLFLYLTSHGSQEHRLSVNLWPLTMNDVEPSDLKSVLDDSGIKYRVLLVSACYSGGFIESLKDEYTLVFTASAKDKQSFGCSNENDFTYFGQAVFKEQMEVNYNLVGAFTNAIQSIRLREISEELEHSEPQLFIGNRIREKLSILTKELEDITIKRMAELSNRGKPGTCKFPV